DGAHRHVLLYNTANFWSSKVTLSIEGYETYHPRWSNLDRFMTQSGPYKEGNDVNHVGHGGKKVEIYLGRFDRQFLRIEQWVKVTRNQRADFFPDVWIDPLSPFAAPRTSSENTGLVSVTHRVPALSLSWPGPTDGLVFLWE